MKKCIKTILIPIETISREIDYKVFLAMSLSIKGFQVIIGKKQSINRLLNRFTNYIYIDKGYHQQVSEEIYRKIKLNNGIILNLDEEGAVDFPNNSTLLNRYSPKMLKIVDKVFLWGNNQKKMIMDKNDGLLNLSVTGHPRFLLLKKKFHGLYDQESLTLKNKYGNFILINTNFGFGNNVNGDEFVEKNYENRFQNISEIIKEDKLKFKAIIELVNNLSKEKNIIIRPHPEEKLETYNSIYSKNKNVKIIRENSSLPWIMASSKCIHIDCTTGIEAAILNKRVISFIPNYLNRDLLTKLPIEVSEVFSSIDKVLFYMNNNKKIKTKKNKVLVDHFSINSSVENLINEINLIYEKNCINSYFFRDRFRDGIYSIKLILKKIISLFYLNPLEKSKLKNYNFKYFKTKFDFFKNKIHFFSNCELKKKGDLCIFNNFN